MSIGLDSLRGQGLHLFLIALKRASNFLGWVGMKDTAGSEVDWGYGLKLVERRH